MALRRGDIVIIVHGDLGRPRPAVVVQTDALGAETTTVLVCPITSLLTERLPIRPIVEADEASGLRKRSQVMTDKLLAVPRTSIREVVGRVDPSIADQLDRALMVVLGLAR